MFKLVSKYSPTGDQPKAIEEIVKYYNDGEKELTLLGATGTGKTFTMANVIQKLGKKTLVLAHNKTLAGQLYSELKSFFPENKVEYFISYYDYYQPEAYVASKDLYIEKDSSINDDIDQMRHSCVNSLLTCDDVIVVSSVSCIYGIGDPDDYRENMLVLKTNDVIGPMKLMQRLVELNFNRNDYELKRGTFRYRGECVDIYLTGSSDEVIRVEFFDDEIDSIKIIDFLTGKVIARKNIITIFPATLFMASNEKKAEAIRRIKEELEEQVAKFKSEGKLLEAQRIYERTNYDLEMLDEIGYCTGIENYSRHMSLRAEGETPYTLIDFFGDDFLLIVDESHVSLPQVRGMYNGDRSRKLNLVNFGFRLPSALDNRPLKYDEFLSKIKTALYVSATPNEFEKNRSSHIVEQIIRPTGLLDPIVEIRKTEGQIDDLVSELSERIKKNERTLIVTLTIKMSEELTKYLKDLNIKVAYLHSEVKSLERMEIINGLRSGKYDCLVGINLLREGLDIPETSLVCILDSDKEGFLRSETSLIQTIGRCARNSNGRVIMYADTITDSMQKAITETYRRRNIQEQYNKLHNITPQTIKKEINDILKVTEISDNINEKNVDNINLNNLSKVEKKAVIEKLEKEMKEAAKRLDFEQAMSLRDLIFELKSKD